jgi:putative ABC transport system substrate-binding protein
MRRRQFITLLASAAAAWPLAARAQQPKAPTIGALVIGNISPDEFWREFRQGLRDLGYIEGQNIGRLCSLPRL